METGCDLPADGPSTMPSITPDRRVHTDAQVFYVRKMHVSFCTSLYHGTSVRHNCSMRGMCSSTYNYIENSACAVCTGSESFLSLAAQPSRISFSLTFSSSLPNHPLLCMRHITRGHSGGYVAVLQDQEYRTMRYGRQRKAMMKI